MSYTEYYDVFIRTQLNKDAKYVMFCADIVNSKTIGRDKERVILLKNFEEFVQSFEEIVVLSDFAATSIKSLVLGDSYLFATESRNAKLLEEAFNQFLVEYTFKFHRSKIKFDVANVTKETKYSRELTWRYAWAFAEDVAKLKSIC